MAEMPTKAPVLHARSQPDIYTLLMIIAILALALTMGFVLHNLMAAVPDGYGLSLGELFQPLADVTGR